MVKHSCVFEGFNMLIMSIIEPRKHFFKIQGFWKKIQREMDSRVCKREIERERESEGGGGYIGSVKLDMILIQNTCDWDKET